MSRYTAQEKMIIDYVLDNLTSDINPIKSVDVDYENIWITYEDGKVISLMFIEADERDNE